MMDEKSVVSEVSQNTHGTQVTSGTVYTQNTQVSSATRQSVRRRQSAVRAMAERTEEEDELARRMNQVFSLMDADDGGSINISEIEKLLMMIGVDISTEEVRSLVKEVDTDGSGEIEREEFVEMMSHKPKPPNSMKEVLRCFKLLAGGKRSKLGYGKINHAALMEMMTKIGRDPMSMDEARQLTKQLEPLKDGTIMYEKYVHMTLKHNDNANPILKNQESRFWREQNERIMKGQRDAAMAAHAAAEAHDGASSKGNHRHRARSPTQRRPGTAPAHASPSHSTASSPASHHRSLGATATGIRAFSRNSQTLANSAPRVASLSPSPSRRRVVKLKEIKDVKELDKIAAGGPRRSIHANLVPHHAKL